MRYFFRTDQSEKYANKDFDTKSCIIEAYFHHYFRVEKNNFVQILVKTNKYIFPYYVEKNFIPITNILTLGIVYHTSYKTLGFVETFETSLSTRIP